MFSDQYQFPADLTSNAPRASARSLCDRQSQFKLSDFESSFEPMNFRGIANAMNRTAAIRVVFAVTTMVAASDGAFGQINTNIETAETLSRQTGRPILAIAGSKT